MHFWTDIQEFQLEHWEIQIAKSECFPNVNKEHSEFEEKRHFFAGEILGIPKNFARRGKIKHCTLFILYCMFRSARLVFFGGLKTSKFD